MCGNNLPLVSVCIPAYNHEQYIEQCIQSIIKQTYHNIELIVVDDGSKDKTWEKLLSLEDQCKKRFTRVVFEHQDNQGTCATLNRATSLAKGKYIYIIASDDVSKPSAISEELDFLENNPDYVLCVGDNEFINEKGERIAWDRNRNVVPSDSGQNTFAKHLLTIKRIPRFDSVDYGSYATLLQGNYIVNGYLIRKETFDKIGGYAPDAPLEDWYIMLQLSKYGKFKFINKILFSYRVHQHNTFTQRDLMRKKTAKTLSYEQILVQQKGYEKWKEIFDMYSVVKKTKFRVGNIIHFYKESDLLHKAYILQILGHKFIVKQKIK